MAFFEWKDSMTVGNPMIDRDHKMLIQYVNEMHAAMMGGKGKDVVGPIVGKLVAYTKDHFAREEVVWKSGHYAELERHRKEHADLVKTVVDFKTKYDTGRAGTIGRRDEFSARLVEEPHPEIRQGGLRGDYRGGSQSQSSSRRTRHALAESLR